MPSAAGRRRGPGPEPAAVVREPVLAGSDRAEVDAADGAVAEDDEGEEGEDGQQEADEVEDLEARLVAPDALAAQGEGEHEEEGDGDGGPEQDAPGAERCDGVVACERNGAEQHEEGQGEDQHDHPGTYLPRTSLWRHALKAHVLCYSTHLI